MPLSPTSVSDEILEALQPLLDDAGQLESYVKGLANMFQLIENYVSDDPDTGAIGYSQLLDLTRSPEEALQWLGQFIGIQLPTGNNIPRVPITQNLILNPSFEHDIFGVTMLSNGSAAVSTLEKYYGKSSLKIEGSTDGEAIALRAGSGQYDRYQVTPGATYSFGIRLHPGTATSGIIGTNKITIIIYWYDRAGAPISNTSTDFSPSSTTWQPLNKNGFVAPANATQCDVVLQCQSVIAFGTHFFYDGAILTQTPTAYGDNYFDGDIVTDTSKRSGWLGLPHRSASQLWLPGSYDQKLDALKAKLSWMRGTAPAMVSAAQATLIGTRRVVLRERFTGDPWKINVVTFTDETPDAAATLAALLTQKPAGIILTHTVVTGQDYQLLLDNHASYSNVRSTYATYAGLELDTPGA